MSEQSLHQSPLGQKSAYQDTYDSTLLFPISRQPARDKIGVSSILPFQGYDIWTAFELSWLNPNGKPMVAMADIIIPCESSYLIESKSFKLYLNSLNNTVFDSPEKVRATLKGDLSEQVKTIVDVKLYAAHHSHQMRVHQFEGMLLDDLDVICSEYQVNPHLLHVLQEHVEEKTVYSHLLKSNCLVTGQPDWGSIQISYSGRKIDESSLLQYIVSYRNHHGFHEHCVERIFMDIKTHCHPKELTVYARYTRRGGLDINPIRCTNNLNAPNNDRLFRQ